MRLLIFALRPSVKIDDSLQFGGVSGGSGSGPRAVDDLLHIDSASRFGRQDRKSFADCPLALGAGPQATRRTWGSGDLSRVFLVSLAARFREGL